MRLLQYDFIVVVPRVTIDRWMTGGKNRTWRIQSTLFGMQQCTKHFPLYTMPLHQLLHLLPPLPLISPFWPPLLLPPLLLSLRHTNQQCYHHHNYFISVTSSSLLSPPILTIATVFFTGIGWACWHMRGKKHLAVFYLIAIGNMHVCMYVYVCMSYCARLQCCREGWLLRDRRAHDPAAKTLWRRSIQTLLYTYIHTYTHTYLWSPGTLQQEQRWYRSTPPWARNMPGVAFMSWSS